MRLPVFALVLPALLASSLPQLALADETAPPKAPEETPHKAAEEAPRKAVVSFEASSPSAELEGRKEGKGEWTTLCKELPCKQPLDPAMHYRFDGSTVVASDTFKLKDGVKRVDAQTASFALNITGKAMVLVGIGGALTGLSLIAASTTVSCNPALPGPCDSRPSATAGAVVTILGAAVIAGGVVILVMNHTSVTIDTETALKKDLGRGVALTPNGLAF